MWPYPYSRFGSEVVDGTGLNTKSLMGVDDVTYGLHIFFLKMSLKNPLATLRAVEMLVVKLVLGWRRPSRFF